MNASSSAPPDLSVLVAGKFRDCMVLQFQLKANRIHDEVDVDPDCMDYMEIVKTFEKIYKSMFVTHVDST